MNTPVKIGKRRGFTCQDETDNYLFAAFNPVSRVGIGAAPPRRQKVNVAPPKTYTDHFAAWLDSFDFDFFCTFTTPFELTVPSARRAMVGLFETLEKDFIYPDSPQLLPDPRNEFKVFFAVEPFDVKEGYHAHALIKYRHFPAFVHERNFTSPSAFNEYLETRTDQPTDNAIKIFNTWQHVTGSRARLVHGNDGYHGATPAGSYTGKFHRADVKPIDKRRGASSYCSKYILKRGADYDLLFLR